jgi:hypothetical protein
MAEIQLAAGTLYPPACYSTEQQRFEAYVAAIVATIIGGIQWEASETAPTDTDLWWQKIDSNGRPVEYLRWSTADGAWIRPFSEVINSATAAGAANAYTLTNAPVMTAATAYRTGATFTFKANHTNSGNATLNVDGLGAKELRKLGGASQVAAGEIISGQMVTVVYDGTYFQVISASGLSSNSGQQLITTVGAANFTVPAGVISLKVSLCGGGGGGGFNASARGGGGGGFCVKTWAVTPGQIIPYVVGAGGARESSYGGGGATNGGNTSFNTTQIGEGGGNGLTTGAAGGFSGADYGINGQRGNFKYTVEQAVGGASAFQGSYGGYATPADSGQTPEPGRLGGGGAGDEDSTDNDASAGGDGAILIEW